MMQSIPIIEVQNCLLISMQKELSDTDATRLQSDILHRLHETGAKGVVLDVSGVEIIDSYIARVFNDIGSSSKKLGAIAFLVGLQPAVAFTLVEMGVELDELKTCSELDVALDILERRK